MKQLFTISFTILFLILHKTDGQGDTFQPKVIEQVSPKTLSNTTMEYNAMMTNVTTEASPTILNNTRVDIPTMTTVTAEENSTAPPVTQKGPIQCDTNLDLTFRCNDDNTCIDRRLDFCDGIPDCPDESDEFVYNETLEESLGISCEYRRQNLNLNCHLPHKYVCDHELDCKTGIDECNCRHTFRCKDGTCAIKSTFCDDLEDCEDGSDEIRYNRTSKLGFQCPVTKKHQTNHCVLPDAHVCDGDSDCDNGVDECFCEFTPGVTKGRYITDVFSNADCFRCLDGTLIIPKKQMCDGIVHCADLSDECLCSQRKNHTVPDVCSSVCNGKNCNCSGQLMCHPAGTASSEKICLPDSAICDSKMDCADGYDENFCAASDQYFNCYDNSTKIRKTLLCNGVPDCEDRSDEDHCDEMGDFFCEYYRRFFDSNIDWNNETQTSDIRIPVNVVLEPHYPFYSTQCDGVPTCPRSSDECAAPACEDNRPEFCQFISEGGTFICNNSGSLLLGLQVCDGTPSCNDTHPTESIDELFCPKRFYCSDRGAVRLPIHIPMENRCDGNKDCDDQSDEIGCPETTHFYCRDGGLAKFIRRAEVCDGTKDCQSGADECQNCYTSPFSSDEKVITSRPLVYVLWIIGIVAAIGNIFVITHQLQQLMRPTENFTTVGRTNRILVLNLATSDLLVGIYLIWLGVMDASTTNYCLFDQEWRSSSTCAIMGTIALIGTETSVFTLLIMTGYRLFLVMRPFKTESGLFAIPASIAAWTLSLILALIPHSGFLIDYFVPCVWYRECEHFGLICKEEMKDFTRELAKRSDSTGKFKSLASGDYTWDNMFDAVAELNSTYRPERFFGYYSAHSVCLPRIFPSREKHLSWGYSLFIILINFVAFAAILVSYLIVYRETTKRRKSLNSSGSKDQATAMQRKITRIVVTDFLCWIPICIMAFVTVSGIDLPGEAYAFTAIILLPINAAMNPFLYSDIVDTVWKKSAPIKKLIKASPCGKYIDKKPADGSTSVSGTNVSGIQTSKKSLTDLTKMGISSTNKVEPETKATKYEETIAS